MIAAVQHEGRLTDRPQHSVILLAAGACPEQIEASHRLAVLDRDVAEVILVCSDDAANVAIAQQLGLIVLESGDDSNDLGKLRRLGVSKATGDVIRFVTVCPPDRAAPEVARLGWADRLRAARVPGPSVGGRAS